MALKDIPTAMTLNHILEIKCPFFFFKLRASSFLWAYFKINIFLGGVAYILSSK